jgi:hypothetical protein
VLFQLSVPAEQERGPQYLAPAITAVHRAFRGRRPWELLLAKHEAHVGLFCRTEPRLSPVVQGQLLAAYPDLRIERIDEAAFQAGHDAVWFSARLRLAPGITPLLNAEHFVDREERQLADPLAALLGAIASGKTRTMTPLVSLAVRPVGRLHHRRLRRRARRRAKEGISAKIAGPLWTVDIRLAVLAPVSKKAAALAKLHELAGVFFQYLPPGSARWKLSRVRTGPLRNCWPLLGRTYLTPTELALLWHPPTSTVRTPQLRINESRELEPPPPGILPSAAQGAVIGRVAFRERRETFGILPEDRFRHVYVVGQTGVGKTTLFTNLIADDVAAGRSTIVLDPHGDMIERLLDSIPPNRTNNVILFDPADRNHVVTYNPLACRSPHDRPLVASAIVTSFKRLFGDSWGPRLEHILRNRVLTLLENPGTTLVSLHKLLVDDSYRKQLVGRTNDPMVRAFWQSEWASWNSQFRAEAISPVLNKVGAFTANPILRTVLGDPAAKLDLRAVLDSGTVLLCNLSKGRLGDDASQLLGSLLVAGIQLAAMSRADQPEHDRVPAMLFADEFQNFVASDTFPTLLAEMRKYRLSLTCAHQYLEQLDDTTAAAVWGNVGTVVAFRLGKDAETVAEQLGGSLTPEDLRNLPKHHAYVRLLIDGMPARVFSMATLPPKNLNHHRGNVVRRVSRQRFGTTNTSHSSPAASVV